MDNPEKTEVAINNGQSRETGNMVLKIQDEDKQNKKYNLEN
jgi:hypothetical protein